jgi:hypothetical protein
MKRAPEDSKMSREEDRRGIRELEPKRIGCTARTNATVTECEYNCDCNCDCDYHHTADISMERKKKRD